MTNLHIARFLAVVAVGLVTAPGATPAAAQAGLPIHKVAEDGVKIDGMARDWRGVDLAEVGQGDDASMRYALAYDEGALYVAAVVRDQRVIRTSRAGRRQDAVVLTLALPRSGDRWRRVELWLFPGDDGRRSATAAVRIPGRGVRRARGAKVVDGPNSEGSGYVLEARVPWHAIPGHERWQSGRGAIRLRDVDMAAHPEVEAEPASAPIDEDGSDRLPPLVPKGGTHSLLHRFLAAKNLAGSRPHFDLRGNVAGDDRPERVVLVDRYVLVLGEGYRSGEAYDFLQLPVQHENDVRDAELRDLTGDGEEELAVVTRERDEHGSRDVWRVIHFDGQRIRPRFGIEVRKKTREGWVRARLRVLRRRQGPPLIEVRTGRTKGLEAGSLSAERRASDVEPILLPWGRVRAKRFRWNGSEFAEVASRPNPDYEPRRSKAKRERKARQERNAGSAARDARKRPSLQQLMAQARRQLGIESGASPRFEQRAHVVADGRKEQVVVLGRVLLVVGHGLGKGGGYLSYRIPVNDPSKVQEVRTADLTGDSAHEVLIRMRQPLRTARGASGNLRRSVLLVQQFRKRGTRRLLAVEVARRQGSRWIDNRVQLARGSDGRRVLVIEPGRVKGWSRRSWPFGQSARDSDIERLLLPWRDRAVRYRFEGTRLVPEAL